jgi:hypothetical protein
VHRPECWWICTPSDQKIVLQDFCVNRETSQHILRDGLLLDNEYIYINIKKI